MSPEQLEIRAEIDEQIIRELGKFCNGEQLDQFKEWIEEETNWQMFWKDSTWIDTKTNKLITTGELHERFERSHLTICSKSIS
jgi:hypothetical protein